MPDANGNPLPGDPVTAPLTNPPTATQTPLPTTYPPPVTVQSTTTAPATTTTTTPATTPATATPATTTATTTPASSVGAPQGQGGTYTVDQILQPFDAEFTNANQAVIDANTQINGRHGATDGNGNPLPDIQGSAEALAAAQAQAIANPAGAQTALGKYQADVSAYTTAQQRLEAANVARSNALQEAIKNGTIDPAQVALANAQAHESTTRANQIDSQISIAQQLAPSQQALLVSQGAQAAAAAQLDQANAAKAKATTASDVALATAQAKQAQAQADSITALTAANKAKVEADTTLTQHQVGLTDSQSIYYQATAAEAQARAGLESAQGALTQAQVAGAPAEQAARTAQAAGAGAASQAQAQQTLADIQQKKLGPAYGLQDQLNALGPIVQQVFHNPANVGKSPDELNGMADDLLKQYVTATMGGTTIGQAAAATATAQQNNFATTGGMVNALQAAQANRANAFAGAEGNVLGTIAQMNQWAPRGSPAGAAAFRSIMDDMATRLASSQFGPVGIPQAPPLPTFLQAFAAGHQAGQAQAAGQPAPGGSAPTISINVNGTGPGGSTPMPYTGGGGPPTPMPYTGYTGGPIGTGPGGSLPMTGMPGSNATPAPMAVPAATAANAQGQQAAFNQGMQASGYNPNAIPGFAQNYMGFANPMQMIGFRGY